jgi:hypothetical protein
MATKKKIKKKRSSATGGGRLKPAKKQAHKSRTPKKTVKRKAPASKSTAKPKNARKTISRKVAEAGNRKTRKKSYGRAASAFSRGAPGSRSGEQSGDLQGLSNVESADSESVDELIEEGNAFEAGVVTGVEEAGERSEREVRTREVPEDDVPGEYLDGDQ